MTGNMAPDDMAPDRSHSGSRRTIPVMVVATVVVVVAALAWDARSTGNDDDPAATAEDNGPTGLGEVAGTGEDPDSNDATAGPRSPEPATSVPLPSESAPVGGAADLSGDDAELLARLYWLLDVGTGDDDFQSTNVPEAEIARCMSDAGFQYVEGPSLEEQIAAHPERSMSAEEYAAMMGLGIVAPDLGMFPSIEDPNLEYTRSLTEGQQQAYGQALGDCRGMTDPERLASSNALNVALSQFRDAVAADDRVVEAIEVWRACMAAAGFHYDDQQAMRQPFVDRSNQGLTREQAEQQLVEEIAIAAANVPCEAAYTETYRAVVLDRFDEFKPMHDTALASGAAPDAQG